MLCIVTTYVPRITNTLASHTDRIGFTSPTPATKPLPKTEIKVEGDDIKLV
jgi:hypothetical protein